MKNRRSGRPLLLLRERFSDDYPVYCEKEDFSEAFLASNI